MTAVTTIISRTLLLAALAVTARSQTLFYDDLESADAACWASRPGSGCSGWESIRDACALTSGGMAHSGKQAIKLTFAKNEDVGGANRIVSSRHIFTRFYDYYEPGFDFAAGMKLHRISSYNAARQLNDFDIILYSQAAGASSNYCGESDMQYLNLAFNGGPVDWGVVGGSLRMERGRWYAIETEVKLNTPGLSDGELRLWVDGKLHVERRNMNLTGTVASPINRVLFGGWYSNSAAGKNPCPDPVRPSYRYVDDAAISSSYIGTAPKVSSGPSPGTRTIAWTMPQAGQSQVEYGTTSAYGSMTPALGQAVGLHSLVVSGLDSNKVYFYRVKTALSAGGQYVSPGYRLSTHPGGMVVEPRRPRRPVMLPAKDFDPIPD